jgi:hypothetical protein
MTYNSAWHIVVRKPELKLCPLFKPHLHTPTPLPLLVLDLSKYQIRPHLLYDLNSFFHTHLSGNLTANVLWYAYLGTLCSTKNQVAWNFLGPKLEVMWRTVAIIIQVILLSTYLCICGLSLSSIHYNQACCIYINQRHQYIYLIWS